MRRRNDMSGSGAKGEHAKSVPLLKSIHDKASSSEWAAGVIKPAHSGLRWRVGASSLLTVPMENTMDHQETQETYDLLYQAGFTASEIDRLEKLRQEYAENKHDHMSETYRRLEFVRWLVTTGKLTEQIA